MKYLNKKNILIFIGGAVSSVVCNQIRKSSRTHTFAVKTVAQGLKFKDDVNHALSSIKEEAEDIYEEAKAEAAEGCACNCDCDSETEAE